LTDKVGLGQKNISGVPCGGDHVFKVHVGSAAGSPGVFLDKSIPCLLTKNINICYGIMYERII